MIERPIDKDLQRFSGMMAGTRDLSRRLAAIGLALIFLLVIALWAAAAAGGGGLTTIFVIGALLSGYMALNIGANDVANNMGPAVGSGAISLPLALVLAAACEASGAILAGGHVADTIASELLIPRGLTTHELVRTMISALFASALWINIATALRAPVSTTHSIVGAVLGGGIAAAGFGVASWPTLLFIAGGWIISPIASGVVASLLLLLTRVTISDRVDKLAAAQRFVPIFVAAMAGAFTVYLCIRGLDRIWQPPAWFVIILTPFMAGLGWLLSRPLVAAQSIGLENRRRQIARLFRLPLVIAAGLLSFAHGANDVSNAIGPLQAIISTLDGMTITSGTTPFWLLSIGALGIAAGLALFGPRLIRTVGSEITKLNEIRAFCIALGTALTVLAASVLGMPVSTTHVALGGVFGIGFLREYLSQREMERKSVPRYARYVDPKALNATPEAAFATARDMQRRRLIRRSNVLTIFGAWAITLPCSAGLSALVYLGLSALVR